MREELSTKKDGGYQWIPWDTTDHWDALLWKGFIDIYMTTPPYFMGQIGEKDIGWFPMFPTNPSTMHLQGILKNPDTMVSELLHKVPEGLHPQAKIVVVGSTFSLGFMIGPR